MPVVTAHVAAGGITTGATSAGVDTTGANLLCVLAAFYPGGVIGVSDSKGNTWVPGTQYTVASGVAVKLYWCVNPPANKLGSAHTFTASGTATYPSVFAVAFNGRDLSTPFDAENGATVGGTTGQPGAVTPAADNEVLVTGVGIIAGSVTSIDSSFTILDSVAYSAGNHMGGALAYKLQTAAATENPVWTIGTTNNKALNIETFKAAPAGGGIVIPVLSNTYRQRR